MDGIEIRKPRFARYILGNATLETLASGFRWIEGPVWMGDANCLLFQDLPNDRTMRWIEGVGVSVYRSPSNYGNGQTRDRQGRLIACSHRGRCLYRTEYDGQVTKLVDRHSGKRLNSPNDVVVKSDGSIWFTDPLYGISNDYEGGRQVSEQPPAVYRFDPESGDIGIVADDFDGRPDNGAPASIYPRLRGWSGPVNALRRRHFSQDRAGLLRWDARRRERQHLEQRSRRGPLHQF
jgi:gluconolactonase